MFRKLCGYLAAAVRMALAEVPATGCSLDDLNPPLAIARSGQVLGFWSNVSAVHPQIQMCWKGMWEQMRAEDAEYNWLLDEDAAGEHDSVTAKDLTLFLATVRKVRKSKLKKHSQVRTLRL